MSAIDSISHAVKNPRTTLRRPVVGLHQLLFDPDAFFARHADDDGWVMPVLVLLVTGAIATAVLVVSIQILQNSYPASGGFAQLEESASNMYLMDKTWKKIYGYAIRPLAGAFVAWLLLSASFLAVSWLYNGHGTYLETLQLTAWGFVPIAIANLLYYGALTLGFALKEYTGLLTAFREQAQQRPAYNDPQLNAYWVINEVREEPWFVLVAIVGLVLTLYSGYLWAYATKHARNLSTEEAYKVVAVPVAIYVGYVGYDLLTYTVL